MQSIRYLFSGITLIIVPINIIIKCWVKDSVFLYVSFKSIKEGEL